MQKLIIGILTACALAVCTTSASASVVTRKAIQKAKPVVGRTIDSVKNFLWKNKTGIAVGAATTAVVMKPEVIANGPLTLIPNSYAGTILLYLLLIAGVRYLLHSFGIWRILPLLVVGLLLCAGVTEAAVIGDVSFPELQCALPGKRLWDILMLLVVVFTAFV